MSTQLRGPPQKKRKKTPEWCTFYLRNRCTVPECSYSHVIPCPFQVFTRACQTPDCVFQHRKKWSLFDRQQLENFIIDKIPDYQAAFPFMAREPFPENPFLSDFA